MRKLGSFFGNLVVSIISFFVMILLAVLSFFVIIFVVSAGATFGGIEPSPDFLLLSATLIVVAAIIAGGISPIAFLTNITVPDDKNRGIEQ